MISWMQKHNRYLVWTIWIATIAFIGAGFVGWGSYNFGSKAGNVAKIGEIEISQSKLNRAYSNLYNQYNQMLGGKLDEKKAKEMGLVQKAFARLETQAKVLNLAKEAGIVVSDKEVADYLVKIPAFQKDGVFNKSIYKNFLQSQHLKAKNFEQSIKEDLTIQKTLSLFDAPSYALEENTTGSALNIADKIAYKVLTPKDAPVNLDEEKIKAFWENNKEHYMTPKMYDLSIVWTGSQEANVTEDELKHYYETNSFNYTDAKGKQLTFEEAKDQVKKDLRLKKTKKKAQKAYIAFKKGKRNGDEKITLAYGDKKLTPELWNQLLTQDTGTVLKPKPVGDSYATVKINKIVPPHPMRYAEAKKRATEDYQKEKEKEILLALAESLKNKIDESNATLSDYLTMNKDVNLSPLNRQETLQFLQKLFTSNKEKGMISVGDKIVVYKIKDQKLLPVDKEKVDFVKQTTAKIKKNIFENNFIKLLDSKYPTEVYMGGLKN